MILDTKPFKDACKKILAAIDNKEKESVLFTETLELKANGDVLTLNVTNREYYVTVSFKLQQPENFHASVNAKLFLNLVAKITTPDMVLTKGKTTVNVVANGSYKIPLIFADAGMLSLPTIGLGTITNDMTINSSILHSVAIYNSKELARGKPSRQSGEYYYIDEQGAITFTTGVCVNNFTLEKPIKMLLDPKVVGLFKLFKSDVPVAFKVGQEELANNTVQTVVSFEADNVSITAILKDSNLISTVPAAASRDMATKVYPHSVVLNKEVLMDAINRIMLFNKYQICELAFNNDHLSVYDSTGENEEPIKYENNYTGAPYKMKLNLASFRSVLEGVEDDYITMNFGDGRSVVVKKSNICDILPEQ